MSTWGEIIPQVNSFSDEAITKALEAESFKTGGNSGVRKANFLRHARAKAPDEEAPPAVIEALGLTPSAEEDHQTEQAASVASAPAPNLEEALRRTGTVVPEIPEAVEEEASASPSTPVVLTKQFPTGCLGRDYKFNVLVEGGIPPYRVVRADGLPHGLNTSDEEHIQITGKPKLLGERDVWFQVSDAAGTLSPVAQISIQIVQPEPASAPLAVAPATNSPPAQEVEPSKVLVERKSVVNEHDQQQPTVINNNGGNQIGLAVLGLAALILALAILIIALDAVGVFGDDDGNKGNGLPVAGSEGGNTGGNIPPANAGQGCRVIHESPLAPLPEVSTSGSHIHVEFYAGNEPERETLIPAREAQGGRFILTQPLKGFVWEYADCTDEQVMDQIRGNIERRRNGGARNDGYVEWRKTGFFRPAIAINSQSQAPSGASASAEPAPAPVNNDNGENRANCATIYGTQYRSTTEQSWFKANCGNYSPPAPVRSAPAPQSSGPSIQAAVAQAPAPAAPAPTVNCANGVTTKHDPVKDETWRPGSASDVRVVNIWSNATNPNWDAGGAPYKWLLRPGETYGILGGGGDVTSWPAGCEEAAQKALTGSVIQTSQIPASILR